jgi:hypothetical protein
MPLRIYALNEVFKTALDVREICMPHLKELRFGRHSLTWLEVHLRLQQVPAKKVSHKRGITPSKTPRAKLTMNDPTAG